MSAWKNRKGSGGHPNQSDDETTTRDNAYSENNLNASGSGNRRAPPSPPKRGGSRMLVAPLTYQGRRKCTGLVDPTASAEIEELLLKVKLIENECIGVEGEETEKLDEFVARKKEIYANLFATKKTIRERCEIQARHGNTVQTIEKGSAVNKSVELLSQQFIGLKEAFKKQSKNPKTFNLTTAELDNRFKELQVIKQQIEECKDLNKRGSEYPEAEMKTLTDFLKQMEQAGVAPPVQFDAGEGGWREPSPEEQATISRWAARDKDFDRQIWQVGANVDRLKGIAIDIGDKARIQHEQAIELTRQADEANEKVVEVNTKLKKLMMAGGGFNFCCKLVLTIILIVVMGFIIKNVTNRIVTPRPRMMKQEPSAGDNSLERAYYYYQQQSPYSVDPSSDASSLNNLPPPPHSLLGSRQRVFVNGTLRTVDDVISQLLNGSSRNDEARHGGNVGSSNRSSLLPPASPPLILFDMAEGASRNSWSRFQKQPSSSSTPPPPVRLPSLVAAFREPV